MRPVFPGCLFFLALGIVLADLRWVPACVAAQVAILLLFVAVGVSCSPVQRVGLAYGVLLAAGILGLDAKLERATGPEWPPFEATLEGQVCHSDRRPGWAAVELCRVSFVDVARPGTVTRVRLVEGGQGLESGPLRTLALGDVVRVRAQVAPLSERRNPGSRGSRRSLERRGVGAQGRLSNPLLVVSVERGASTAILARMARWIDTLRQKISNRLQGSGAGGELLAALGVGDQSGLGEEVRDAFRKLGVSHLLAISGLHLYLVAGFAYATTWLILCRLGPLAAGYDLRRASLLAAVVIAFGYALLAGWGVPVRRALVLILALSWGFTAQRVNSGLNILAAAGLGILVLDPAALFEPGAQLSFGASAGLLISAGRVSQAQNQQPSPHWGLKLVRSGYELLRVSAVAIASTAPLIVLYGWPQSPFGLIANLFAVPVTALFLLPLALGGALIAALPSFWIGADWLAFAATLANLCMQGVVWLASWLPGSAEVRPPPMGIWVLSCGLALFSIGQRRAWAQVLGCVLVLALLIGGGAPVRPSLVGARLVVLEVGQGDAILVQGESAAVLVDAGWGEGPRKGLGETAVVPALFALGVTRLDVVVATHADADHRGGLEAVLARVPVGELWLPARGRDDPEFAPLVTQALERGTRVVERGAGDAPLRLGDLLVKSIWPPRTGDGLSRNERSLVIRVEKDEFSVLLTGDIGVKSERLLIESGIDLRSTVLKVGHHGSRGSSSRRFLDAVNPAVAIVSAGCHTRRSLPSQEALARLSSSGAVLWWTGRDGAVVVPMDEPLRVLSWRPKKIRTTCGDTR